MSYKDKEMVEFLCFVTIVFVTKYHTLISTNSICTAFLVLQFLATPLHSQNGHYGVSVS